MGFEIEKPCYSCEISDNLIHLSGGLSSYIYKKRILPASEEERVGKCCGHCKALSSDLAESLWGQLVTLGHYGSSAAEVGRGPEGCGEDVQRHSGQLCQGPPLSHSPPPNQWTCRGTAPYRWRSLMQ